MFRGIEAQWVRYTIQSMSNCVRAVLVSVSWDSAKLCMRIDE